MKETKRKVFKSVVSDHNNFIKLDKDLLEYLGVNKALVLCLICAKQESNGVEKVFIKREEIKNQTGLSNGTITKAFKDLEQLGLIKIQRGGNLNRNYYKPIRENITKIYKDLVISHEQLTINLDIALKDYNTESYTTKDRGFINDYLQGLTCDSYDQKNDIEDLISRYRASMSALASALHNYYYFFEDKHPRCKSVEELIKVLFGFDVVISNLESTELGVLDFINWFYKDSKAKHPLIATMLSTKNMYIEGTDRDKFQGYLDYLEIFINRYNSGEIDISDYRQDH